MAFGDTPPAGQAASVLLTDGNGRVLLVRHGYGLHGTYFVHGMQRPSVLSHVFRARLRVGVPHIGDELEITHVLWCDPHRPPTPLTNDAQVALLDHAAGRSGCERVVERRT